MYSFASKKKLDPKAKVRNRGKCCIPAEHPKNKGNKDKYPINSEDQARNAIARVNQHKKVPDWWKGSLQELINTVYRCVKAKYKNIKLDPKKKKPGKQSMELILGLYRQAASFIDKKARWEDFEFNDDPEDDYDRRIESYDPEERMEYYLGGSHPGNFYDDNKELQPEDHELKEPAFRFDPKEHLERGGRIVGKDDAPYIEDERGKHYDIYPEDRDILEEEEGELNQLGEISRDLPDFNETKEDIEYLKEKNIDENEDVSDIPDYEPCAECGFDHEYEPEEAQLAHSEIE